ncbi:MAG: hypothetical protein EOP51_15190 [Sphingobacteriales bacterium]|nr:MAG: hypothetical protein EOP51_15190 [Sphingobacteriales bacterium]
MKFTYPLLLLAALVTTNPVKAQSYYLDHSFGTNGCVSNLSVTPNSRVNDIEIQPDGKIVGILYNSLKFQVFRLKKTGDLDLAFGVNGFADVQLSATASNYAVSLALQPDGKILVAGVVHQNDDDIAILRFNTDGSADASFGNNGVVKTGTYTGCNDMAQKLLLRPDGKILVAARKAKTGEKTKELLIQYKDDGDIDNSFGTNGMVMSSYDGNETDLQSATLQPDGKILTTGYTYVGQVSNADVFVTRYNEDGSIDMNFGDEGRVIKNYVPTAKEDGRRILVQSSGKIVVACYATMLSFLTFRLNEDGTDDKRYGTNGVSSLNLNLSDFSFDAMLVGKDEILIGGNVETTGSYDYNIVRLDKNGNSKYTFGANGQITTDVFGYPDYLFTLAQQADGKIVAAGSSIKAIGGLPYPSMIRYVANPVNGVEDVLMQDKIAVYPNPCYGSFTVMGTQSSELYLYDIMGKLLRKIELKSSNDYSIIVSDIPKGFALLRDVEGTVAYKIEVL